MKTWLRISCLLNVLLGGLAIWLIVGEARHSARAGLWRRLPQRVMRSPAKSPPAPAVPPAEAAPQVIEVAAAFHWSQLEADDYHVYLANLRALGCPEETVRDLIVADVDDLFSARVKQLVDGVTGDFWRCLTHPDEMEKLVGAKYDELRALDDERDELLKSLFNGKRPCDLEAEEEAQTARRTSAAEAGDFLSAEKRAAYGAANEEHQRGWSDFLQTPNLTGPMHQAKRNELDAARWTTLAAVLTPEEVAELRLRESSAAGVRRQLVGLDLSESEVRLAAQAQLAKEAAKGKSSSAQAEAGERALREALGPERYAAFQRGVDPRFHEFHRVAERLDLPEATALQAYEIRVQAEQAAQRVRKDKTIEAATRTNLLQAIQTEATQTLATSLGTSAFVAYQKIGGSWLPGLSEAGR